MAVTKRQLAEQAQRIILGGTQTADREVFIQELLLAVNQAFANAVKLSLFNNKREGENDVNGSFIYSFDDVPVSFDNNKKLYYSELPATYIDLPTDLGVAMVSLMEGQNDAFVRVPQNFLSLTRGLQSGSLLGRSPFWVENTRLYFPSIKSSDNITKVLVKLIAGIDSIDDDQNVGIPLDIQDQIVRTVVQMYMVEQTNAKDELNDDIK